MSLGDKGFTFTWEIENFSMLRHQQVGELKSNMFTVEQFENVEWRLSVYPRGNINNSLSFYLSTNDDLESKLTCSATIVSTETSSNITRLIENQSPNYYFGDLLNMSTIYEKKELYLPNDTLTLRCCLRPASNETNVLDEAGINFLRSCKSRTSTQVKRRSVTFPVNIIKDLGKFSNTIFIELGTLDMFPGLIITLDFMDSLNNDFVKIEIRQTSLPGNNKQIIVKCKMTVVSAHSKYQDSKEGTHLFQLSLDDVWHFPDFLIASNLTRDQYLYLNDTMYLHCEFAFSCTNAEYNLETNYTPLALDAMEYRTVSELDTNLEDMYLGGNFCDVELRVGGEALPAHKVVLCAMSPVFRAMFQNETKERDSNVVQIDDVDSETVRKMLRCMYSNAVKEDLSLESAIKLFSAADKYALETLRRECSIWLVSYLTLTSVCDVLVLADAHQDNFLLTAVLNFITCYASETFRSQHWKRFMDINPKLSGKVMHQVLEKRLLC